jgi:uncharacterized protein YoaH (UPF0181 family)
VSRTIYVDGPSEATVENAIAAVDNDPQLPDVDRTRGPTSEGHVSTGEALALVAQAYTGWEADAEEVAR